MLLSMEPGMGKDAADFARTLPHGTATKENIPPYLIRAAKSAGLHEGGMRRTMWADSRFASVANIVQMSRLNLHLCVMTKRQAKGVPVTPFKKELHRDGSEFGDVLCRKAVAYVPANGTQPATEVPLALVGQRDADVDVIFTVTSGNLALAQKKVHISCSSVNKESLVILFLQITRKVGKEFKTICRPEVMNQFYTKDLAHSAVDVFNEVDKKN